MEKDESEGRIVTLAEVRAMLIKDEEQRELTYDKRVALDHARTFAPLSPDMSRKLVDNLTKIERVTPSHAVKISEILPRDVDELRPVFAKERFTLEEDEIKAILSEVEKYLEE